MSGRLKGQFFILGALLLSTLFFLFLPSQVAITGGQTRDIDRIADNLESEIPTALNLAMLEDGSPQKLGQFTEFLRDEMSERFIDMESLWVVTIPDQSTPGHVEAYAGNWLGESTTVSVTIEANEETLNLDDGEIDSVEYFNVDDEFDIVVSFDGRSWSGHLARDKVNLYCLFSLSREENIVVKEIIG
jgi:hypothetical protein